MIMHCKCLVVSHVDKVASKFMTLLVTFAWLVLEQQ